MRVVLANPSPQRSLQTHRYGVGHLGLGYVAACLLEAGHDVVVVDAKAERLDRAATVDRIQAHSPALFGVTAMTHEIHEAASLCAAVKERHPLCLTVVGGPHVTALPARTLREFPGIDVAVIGEGELTACDLAAAVAASPEGSRFAAIPGIAYRAGAGVHRTAARPPIADLDAVPFPAWHLFPRDVTWPVFAGRGCPFRCAFCQRVLGNRVRLRTPANVIAEFDAMQQQLGVKGTWFQDETFGVNRRWTHDLLDRMIDRNRRSGYVWHWKANSRANIADGGLYRKMKQAGCHMLDFGIESGSPLMLKRIHKDITLSQAKRAIRLAKEAGLKTNTFFIIGHPGETWETALQTVRMAPWLGTDMIAVGIMVPYPGTEIWEFARKGEYGYRLLSEDWRVYDKYLGNALELRGLSRRQLELLQALTYLAFYVGTGRYRDLLEFLSKFHNEAREVLRRMCRMT
ncbi:MAG TPA: radical SAM protein [Phycisphaerae bacterium]|nr:radical SAM protein [Phycisphaerae bacterium]